MSARAWGLDLSLTATGVASTDPPTLRTVRTKRGVSMLAPADQIMRDDLRRIAAILDDLTEAGALARQSDLLVIEGPSLGQSRQAGEHTRAGLWWMTVASARCPVLVVPPAKVKVYATGKGTSAKDAVMAAVIRRYPTWPVADNNQADALVLAAIGARMLGDPIEDSLPQSHLRALDTLTLPDGAA